VIDERAYPGLHDAAFAVLEAQRGRALDLGTGAGGMAQRLADAGMRVDAADIDPSYFAAQGVDFHTVDLNAPAFADELPGPYDVVTAIEVIEHLENPIAFLRNVARLLAPTGVALLTTPHMESITARGKFLLKGQLRAMDAWGDPTHISPMFRDLLVNRYLPAAGLRLARDETYPKKGFVGGNKIYERALAPFGALLARRGLAGDSLVLVLQRTDAAPGTAGG
jgi:SAM-dependent methyltransferase